MPWRELEPPPLRTYGVPIKIGVRGAGGGWLYFTAAKASELRFAAGDKFTVQVGEGPHAGHIRVSKSDKGKFVARAIIKGAIRIRLGDLPDMPDTLKSVPCKFVLSGEALEVVLPWEVEQPLGEGASIFERKKA